MSEAKLIILSGPSGVGKKTVRELLDLDALNLVNSVSWTTRDPREEDIEGVTYHFVTPEEFEANVARDGFVEHAGFDKHAYGTPKEPLENWLKEGRNVLLEIEVNGAEQVMAKYPQAESIFLIPPTIEELKKRLIGRNSESEESVRTRLETAEREMGLQSRYRHVVVNDDPQRAADEIAAIIAA